jgi:hypothetical protein
VVAGQHVAGGRAGGGSVKRMVGGKKNWAHGSPAQTDPVGGGGDLWVRGLWVGGSKRNRMRGA